MAKKDREVSKKIKEDYRKMNEVLLNEMNPQEKKTKT